MTRRIVAITVAIALAALGAAGGLFLILTADKRAQDRVTDGVSVYVASTNIPIGTTVAQVVQGNMAKQVRVAKGLVPADALTDFTPVDGLVLVATVHSGTVLMKGNFGQPGEAASGLALTKGLIAVTVQTGAPQQVAGYLRAGSQIVIFLTYNLVDSKGNKTNEQRTKVLLSPVQVLSVGSGTTGQGGGSLMITVAVSPADAERLIQGQSTGKLYLGLLGDSTTANPDGGVNNYDNSGGANPLFP
jgi:pilus assembly protein CpaB